MGLHWECPAESTCATWALSYFADCVCSWTDWISFFLGIASIVCWAVSEFPQILVNLRTPGAENVSLAFVFTWMTGDIFNLAGCWISPGTLPTQFYLALLYSAATFLLVGQQIWYAWISYRESRRQSAADPLLSRGRLEGRPPAWHNDPEGELPSDRAGLSPGTRSLPVLNKRGRQPLVTVSLPGPPFPESPQTYSSSWRRLAASSSSGSPVARGLLYSSLVFIGVTLVPLSRGEFMQQGGIFSVSGVKRHLQQGWTDKIWDESGKNKAASLGLVLGWAMTCIYLTGRLPQVILNWSRELVIGVSTPTVIFAFLGNSTYLGSILVRSVQWAQLKPVLPWVIDITCCLLMDIFMTTRYLLHQYQGRYTMLE